jgi:hypothetical protein
MLILALAVLSLVAVLPADVFAQAAPTPQVTISGFIQQVTSYRHNYSATDLNFGRTNDTEWYARTRGRFDLTGQVGQVIGRLGLEVDAMWGQSGINDCQGTHSGTNCAFDQNTDMSAGSSISGTSVSTAGSIELRHLWTQFPVTGKDSLMPFIPVDTVGRFGGQPYAFSYKGAVLATGDFGGVDLVTTITPNIRTQVIYTQIEEQVETLARSSAVTGFGTRGDDHAILFGVDITPIKGLDIKPMYAYLFIDGLTGQARLAKGGFSAGGGGPFSPGGSLGRAAGLVETRHTLGFDARWRMGPISIEPTLLYQFGSRESVITAGRLTAEGAVGTRRDADISAWLLDVRGGYRVGPLLVEGLFFWTSGNRARDQLTQNVNYYQPISTDTTYLATWAEILALNIDFNQGLTSLGTHIGYDRYGRIGIGARVFYDLTPALTFNFKWNTQWTDKSVDTDGFLTAGAGLTPSIVDRVSLRSARPEGDSRYLGTELDLGFTWRFAPGVTFDAVYGYLITGPAFGVRAVASDYNAGAGLPLNKDRNVNGVQIFSARVNYNF